MQRHHKSIKNTGLLSRPIYQPEGCVYSTLYVSTQTGLWLVVGCVLQFSTCTCTCTWSQQLFDPTWICDHCVHDDCTITDTYISCQCIYSYNMQCAYKPKQVAPPLSTHTLRPAYIHKHAHQRTHTLTQTQYFLVYKLTIHVEHLNNLRKLALYSVVSITGKLRTTVILVWTGFFSWRLTMKVLCLNVLSLCLCVCVCVWLILRNKLLRGTNKITNDKNEHSNVCMDFAKI